METKTFYVNLNTKFLSYIYLSHLIGAWNGFYSLDECEAFQTVFFADFHFESLRIIVISVAMLFFRIREREREYESSKYKKGHVADYLMNTFRQTNLQCVQIFHGMHYACSVWSCVWWALSIFISTKYTLIHLRSSFVFCTNAYNQSMKFQWIFM